MSAEDKISPPPFSPEEAVAEAERQQAKARAPRTAGDMDESDARIAPLADALKAFA
jgi:hypothetical protein